MCDHPLTGKQELYHSPACKVAYDRNSKKIIGNVTDVTARLEVIGELAQVVQRLEHQLQAIPEAVERAVANAIAEHASTSTPSQNDALPDDIAGLLTIIAQNTGYGVDDNNDIIKTLQSIDNRLAAMERRQPRITAAPPPSLASSNMKGVGQLAARDDNDDDIFDLLDVKEATPQASNAGQNLINSLIASQGIKSTKSPTDRPLRKIKEVSSMDDLLVIKPAGNKGE